MRRRYIRGLFPFLGRRAENARYSHNASMSLMERGIYHRKKTAYHSRANQKEMRREETSCISTSTPEHSPLAGPARIH